MWRPDQGKPDRVTRCMLDCKVEATEAQVCRALGVCIRTWAIHYVRSVNSSTSPENQINDSESIIDTEKVP